jgi:hypothetical protein
MRQAWSDASEGHHRADKLLLRAFFVTFSALALCAGFGVLRDRRWAIWTLRVVGSLVLLDTLCYFIMCDFAWDALAALVFAIITLMGLMFVKRS